MGHNEHPAIWYSGLKSQHDLSRYKICTEPFDNIYIGSSPLDGMEYEFAKSFDAIVNVSCTPCALFEPAYPGQRMYWIPINEMGVWNYSAFVQFFKVMDFHHEYKHKIYVHCHAGAYRSPTMTMIWIKSLNYTWEQADAITLGLTDEEYEAQFPKEEKGRFRLRYFRGNMPKNFNAFLLRLEHNRDLPYSYTATLECGNSRISNDREVWAPVQGNTLKNRLLRPYRRLKSKIRYIKDWWKSLTCGYQTVRLSNCCTSTTEGDDFVRKFFLERVRKRVAKKKGVTKK